MYTAAEIVPIAQRDGLIAEVDRWVMSRCLLVLAERARQQRNVRLFVNQSIETAGDAQHVVWLKQMLETRRLDADQLVVEFRMADAQAHLHDLIEFAAEIRKLGVRVALSAFGRARSRSSCSIRYRRVSSGLVRDMQRKDCARRRYEKSCVRSWRTRTASAWK